MDRDLAVKIIRPAGAGVSSALDHAKALARAQHENVVSVISLESVRDPDSGEKAECVVVELIEGETLTERLSGLKFSVEEARRIGVAIAEGLTHIHKQGMEHGDLHSDNVMVTAHGTKVIGILYRDSLAILSTASREARLRRDRTSLRLLLQEIILHSELDAAEAAEFNELLDDNASTSEIRDAFLKITEPSNLSNTSRILEHAYARVADDRFADGEAHAAALTDEPPSSITVPLLRRIVDERSYKRKHAAYLNALWSQCGGAACADVTECSKLLGGERMKARFGGNFVCQTPLRSDNAVACSYCLLALYTPLILARRTNISPTGSAN